MGFLIWIEEASVSVWIRETPSLWGFPFILYLHTLGLALIAGLSSAIALAILVLPSELPRRPLVKLFPLMWTGLAINAVSGLALLCAYPAKALTNPVFYIKLVAIAVAVGIVHWLQTQWTTSRADANAPESGGAGVAATPALKRAAAVLLASWLIATLTGRLLAYTHSILMASQPGFF